MLALGAAWFCCRCELHVLKGHEVFGRVGPCGEDRLLAYKVAFRIVQIWDSGVLGVLVCFF